jgi:hypothetical protein
LAQGKEKISARFFGQVQGGVAEPAADLADDPAAKRSIGQYTGPAATQQREERRILAVPEQDQGAATLVLQNIEPLKSQAAYAPGGAPQGQQSGRRRAEQPGPEARSVRIGRRMRGAERAGFGFRPGGYSRFTLGGADCGDLRASPSAWPMLCRIFHSSSMRCRAAVQGPLFLC